MRRGWHLAEMDSRDDFVQDALRHADFALSLDRHLTHLTHEIVSERYRPRSLIEIDVPKSLLSVRPGSVLPIEEATILHAVVSVIAPRLDRLLSPSVYSYRLHKQWQRRVQKGRSLFVDDELELPFLKRATIRRFDPMESWYIAWPEFDQQRRVALAEQKFTHATKTDISAYFENIDLRLVEQSLTTHLPDEPHLVSLVMRILSAWTRTSAHGVTLQRGLPQGNDVSSFLANIYLLPLDDALRRFCRRRRGAWFRYVDDVDVFTHSEDDAREAVFVINQALRSLHLNLQGSKTAILSSEDLKTHYDRKPSELIEAVARDLQAISSRHSGATRERREAIERLKPLASTFRRGLPKSIKSLDQQRNRAFRRMLTIYGSLGSAWLLKPALAVLHTAPELRLLQKTMRYMSQMPYQR